MKESVVRLCIAEDVGTWAASVLQVLEGLPQGIFSDSISLSPTVLPFGPVINLEIKEQAIE